MPVPDGRWQRRRPGRPTEGPRALGRTQPGPYAPGPSDVDHPGWTSDVDDPGAGDPVMNAPLFVTEDGQGIDQADPTPNDR